MFFVSSVTRFFCKYVYEGAWAWVDIFSLHHNPHVWDNPEVEDVLD